MRPVTTAQLAFYRFSSLGVPPPDGPSTPSPPAKPPGPSLLRAASASLPFTPGFLSSCYLPLFPPRHTARCTCHSLSFPWNVSCWQPREPPSQCFAQSPYSINISQTLIGVFCVSWRGVSRTDLHPDGALRNQEKRIKDDFFFS